LYLYYRPAESVVVDSFQDLLGTVMDGLHLLSFILVWFIAFNEALQGMQQIFRPLDVNKTHDEEVDSPPHLHNLHPKMEGTFLYMVLFSMQQLQLQLLHYNYNVSWQGNATKSSSMTL
jgi:hypothetical protein